MTHPTPAPTAAPVTVALVQVRGGTGDKNETIDNMRRMVLAAVNDSEASGQRVQLAVLPEVWNSRISTADFEAAAEPVPEVGESIDSWDPESLSCIALSEVAKEANVWLIGGTVTERQGDKRYNTSTVYSPDGELVLKFRKAHLFDLCLPEMTYKESDQFSAGHSSVGHFDTPFGRIGLGICYDIRFPEMAMIASRIGCVAMFYPAAFNTVTGPLHWELLQRARALDNQMYVATSSVARDTTTKLQVYGHSMAVSPMGAVVAEAGIDEQVVTFTIEPKVLADTRAGIPISIQRRFDLYPDIAADFKISA